MIDELKRADEITHHLLDWGADYLKLAIRLRFMPEANDEDLVSQLDRFDRCCIEWRAIVTHELIQALRIGNADCSVTNDACCNIFYVVIEAFNAVVFAAGLIPPDTPSPFNTAESWKLLVEHAKSIHNEPDEIAQAIRGYAETILDAIKAKEPLCDQADEVANEFAKAIHFYTVHSGGVAAEAVTRKDIAERYFELGEKHSGRGSKQKRFEELKPMFEAAGVEYTVSNLNSITKQYPNSKR